MRDTSLQTGKMNFTRLFVSGSLIFCAFSPMQLTAAPFPPVMDLLEKPEPFVTVSPELFQQLGKSLALPDAGRTVKELADKSPGGAFDPRDLERIAPATLGYRAKWSVVRYPYYGLDWDITGLRLESLDPKAKALPWIVIINGGSANWYEFFVDPLNRPGLGQYLAQSANVLIVTIPGNFKYGGWTLPASQRSPQYLVDRDLSADEVKVRNTIYTNSMAIEGLRRLIARETTGDLLIVGHSTSGELAFLAMGEKELAAKLKGRFLGWGSGGPSNLRKEWEEQVGRRAANVKALAKYPPLWELRPRDAEEYVNSGYIGPLNPVAAPGMTDLQVAERWLALVERNRPNFKQVLQDLEHYGMVELQAKLEGEMREALAATKLPSGSIRFRRTSLQRTMRHSPATAACSGWWASGIKPIGTRRPPRRPGSSPSRTSSGRGTPARPSGSWFSICP